MTDHTQFHPNFANIANYIRQIFNKDDLKRLAIKTGFIKQYNGRLDGYEIVLSLVEKALRGDKTPLSICCDAIASLNPRAQMTRQSLQERINSPGCAEFFKNILEQCLQKNLQPNYLKQLSKLSPMGKTMLHRYTTVKALDSSEIALNSKLKNKFKGPGGEKNAESCLKILAVFELRFFTFEYFKITDRTEPDSVLGKQLTDLVEAGAMYLMDKGFVSRNVLEEIEAKHAYYIAPLPASNNVYSSKTSDVISLPLRITKSLKKHGYFDEIIFISKSKKPVRCIAYQLSEKSTKKRIEGYLKKCRKQRIAPTEEGLTAQGLVILITNDLSIKPEIVSCLYSLRWQIELVFKTWKSQMNMDHCLGTNSNRIYVLICSRLIAATILSLALSPVMLVLEVYYDKELSLYKVVNWIGQRDRAFSLLCGDLLIMQTLLHVAEKWLCKEDNRRRKTTKQRLNDMAYST